MADDTFIGRLRADVDLETDTLMGVAEGRIAIQDANEEYKKRRRGLRSALKRLGLSDPNNWPDLWLWYGRYKDDDELRSYQSRREFIILRYQPLIETLDNLADRQLGTGIDIPTTGWAPVDRQVEQLREMYARADTPEQFRQVGLLCRDIFISLGYVVFDPEKHLSEGEPMPKRDNAKDRLAYAVGAEYGGRSNVELRGLVRATWTYVQDRVHDQSEDRRDAMIAADATIHLVKVLAALFPRPTGKPPPANDENEYEDEIGYEEPDPENWDFTAEDWATADEPPYGDR